MLLGALKTRRGALRGDVHQQSRRSGRSRRGDTRRRYRRPGTTSCEPSHRDQVPMVAPCAIRPEIEPCRGDAGGDHAAQQEPPVAYRGPPCAIGPAGTTLRSPAMTVVRERATLAGGLLRSYRALADGTEYSPLPVTGILWHGLYGVLRTNQNAVPHAAHQCFDLIVVSVARTRPIGVTRWLRHEGHRRSTVSGSAGSGDGMGEKFYHH